MLFSLSVAVGAKSSNPGGPGQRGAGDSGSQVAPKTAEMNQKTEVTRPPESKHHAEPVEQRWEEAEGKYLHKKFKKMATAVSEVQDEQQQAAVSEVKLDSRPPQPLKHSALSMIHPASTNPASVSSHGSSVSSGSNSSAVVISSRDYMPHHNTQNVLREGPKHEVPRETSQGFNIVQPPSQGPPPPQEQDERKKGGMSNQKKKNVCPFCHVSCAKPSVLDKHIRTHTNERPYPCQPCGFAFKTKSNLYKHCKSRTHNLKVEKGIDSSKEEIVAELGDSGHEEVGNDLRLPIMASQEVDLSKNSRQVAAVSVPLNISRHVYPSSLSQGFEIIPVQKGS